MRAGALATQWATVLVLLALFAAIAYWRPQWVSGEVSSRPTQDRPAGGRYHAIDGDSFTLGDREIRLHGIDAPEYRQTCRAGGGKMVNCGKLARDELSRLIGAGTVTCRVIERDRYGRQVSDCMAGETNINREMVRNGWAVAYRRHLDGLDLIRYAKDEQDAHAARRGIWQWVFETPETYRTHNRAFQGGLGGTFKDD